MQCTMFVQESAELGRSCGSQGTEVQMAMTMEVLGTESRSPARAVDTLTSESSQT